MPFVASVTLNYNSPTGFGGFEITIRPNGTLEIRVRLHWQFVPGRELFRGAGPEGEDIVQEHPWNAGESAAFKNTFLTNIPQTWNRKWRFRCTHPNYAGVYEPTFILVDGTAHNRHIPIEVENAHGLSYLHGTQGKLMLHKYDNLMFDDIPASVKSSPSRATVMRGVMERVHELVSSAENITLIRTGDTWNVMGGDTIALRTLATGLNGLQPYMQTVPIKIRASSGATGKATALVNTAADFLQNHGGMNLGLFNIQREAVTTRKKFKLPGTAHKVRANVSITVDEGSWKFIYRVSDHEFGHCIGLPDEYTLYPGAIRGAHAIWRGLCRRANVPANATPARLGANLYNSSIMSYGWVTCACHYVTIWAALVDMTRNAPYNIQPNQWVIERGTESQNVT